MRPVQIGLLGLGTVGAGTLNVLTRNAEEIARRAGRSIVVSHAASRTDPSDGMPGLSQVSYVTRDAFALVREPEVDIIVELIGGCSPARELVLEAISRGKHVVTANKALIALHGNAIFAAARERGVMVAFEGAVAGGIPLIKTLREGLSANRILWLAGIINGTGNYILSAMRSEGKDFATALDEAQSMGYAEADPDLDIGGGDAAHKLTILGSIAFGIPLQFTKTYVEGIADIKAQDVRYAEELGYYIKHLGIARRTEKGIEMRVHPCLIPQTRLLSQVDGVMNAVVVVGDASGPSLYYGAGAGAEPTASAVVADVVDVTRTLTVDPGNRVPHLAFQSDTLSELPVLDRTEIVCAYYLRMQTENRPGMLGSIAEILGASGISIRAVKQREEDRETLPVVILTQAVREGQMDEAIMKIEALQGVQGPLVRLRVETLK